MSLSFDEARKAYRTLVTWLNDERLDPARNLTEVNVLVGLARALDDHDCEVYTEGYIEHAEIVVEFLREREHELNEPSDTPLRDAIRELTYTVRRIRSTGAEIDAEEEES